VPHEASGMFCLSLGMFALYQNKICNMTATKSKAFTNSRKHKQFFKSYWEKNFVYVVVNPLGIHPIRLCLWNQLLVNSSGNFLGFF
jgi:hypothetical protein